MDLHGRMVRIETKLDSHAENHTALKATADDLEGRVSKLETAYRILAAAGAVVVFVLTFLQDSITNALGI
jgi:hypothetical protein